jgi:hypothetical protein
LFLANLLEIPKVVNKVTSMDDDTNDLDPCELGKKQYWEDQYSTEIRNYLSHGDPGEVWFDESSQFRVIKWMNASGVNKNDSIIDLGRNEKFQCRYW